ncbi:MAG: DUF6268 family outer membrane beta-barrel protein [Bdellovibrionota bacterium]
MTVIHVSRMFRKTQIVLSALLMTSIAGLSVETAAADNLASEHGDFFHLLNQKREDISLDYQYEPDFKEDGGPGKFDMNKFAVAGEVPLEIGSDQYFRIGGAYSARVYDFKEVRGASTSTDSNTLHAANVLAGLGSFVTKNLLVAGDATLGTYSDFDGGLEEEDFRIYGEAEAVYRVNPGAELLAGLRWNEDFDDAPIYPIMGLRLLSEDGKLNISLTAPVELRVGYSIHPDIELFGRVGVAGEEYRISSGSRENFKVHLQERRAGLGVNWWLGGHFKLGCEAGVSFGDEFKFKTESPGQFENDLKPGGYLIANAGIAL